MNSVSPVRPALTARPANSSYADTQRAELAREVNERFVAGVVDLLPVLPSGVEDGADARSNITDTAAGRPAKLSSYGNAPGGETELSTTMLEGLLTLSSRYSFRITTIAGGSHSRRSRHYLGVAFDVDTLDGRRVSRNHPTYRNFMRDARELGATEVLGPGNRGHDRHMHISWPRNASAHYVTKPGDSEHVETQGDQMPEQGYIHK